MELDFMALMEWFMLRTERGQREDREVKRRGEGGEEGEGYRRVLLLEGPAVVSLRQTGRQREAVRQRESGGGGSTPCGRGLHVCQAIAIVIGLQKVLLSLSLSLLLVFVSRVRGTGGGSLSAEVR
jgi:hypothetical protein